MNDVSVVGKLSKVYDSTNARSSIKVASAMIAVTRPYKVGGETKADIFQIRAWGKVAERLLLAFPSQIIGVSGILETDQSKATYINARSIFFYGKEEADKINESTIPYEQIEALSGFAGITSSDIPDF